MQKFSSTLFATQTIECQTSGPQTTGSWEQGWEGQGLLQNLRSPLGPDQRGHCQKRVSRGCADTALLALQLFALLLPLPQLLAPPTLPLTLWFHCCLMFWSMRSPRGLDMVWGEFDKPVLVCICPAKYQPVWASVLVCTTLQKFLVWMIIVWE